VRLATTAAASSSSASSSASMVAASAAASSVWWLFGARRGQGARLTRNLIQRRLQIGRGTKNIEEDEGNAYCGKHVRHPVDNDRRRPEE
jgi:hypothetical protein